MTEHTASHTRIVLPARRLTGAGSRIVGVLSATLLAGALALAAQTAGANVRPVAHGVGARARAASHALSATDTAHLRYIRASGSELFEEGSASGSLPGKMDVQAEVGPTLKASFTVFVHGGTIKGRGTAKAHGSGRYESFAGTLTVTGGTGRYAHAHGHAGLYGVFDRRTYAMTVQTTGRLLY